MYLGHAHTSHAMRPLDQNHMRCPGNWHTTAEEIVCLLGFVGYRDIPTVADNQMENNTENQW